MADEYFLGLEPIVYESRQAAAEVTLKQFMTNNVRMHVPAVYKQLVDDWPALELWQRPTYLTKEVGDTIITAYNYLADEPYKAFAGEGVYSQQAPLKTTYARFMEAYIGKFFDKKLRNPLDTTNLFMELKRDLHEPDAVNIAFDYERTTWSLMSRNAKTMTRYNHEEMLHCVVAGAGEHFTLASPY